MVSPGVTPSPFARRRRRRRGVDVCESSPSSEISPASKTSSVSVSRSSVVSPASLPPRRRPRPPRRRRRKPESESESSSDAASGASTTSAFALTFLGATASGAAWNIGTGMLAAEVFLVVFFSTVSTSTTSGVSAA